MTPNNLYYGFLKARAVQPHRLDGKLAGEFHQGFITGYVGKLHVTGPALFKHHHQAVNAAADKTGFLDRLQGDQWLAGDR